MALLDTVNTLFKKLLSEYKGGISNTSTTKYNDIKSAIGAALSISVENIQATGSKDRISNLDTRLPQGNWRGQTAPLALVFLAEKSKGEDEATALDRIRNSFSTTAEKFVSGLDRGTTFDGILAFIQLDGKSDLKPLRFIHTNSCSYSTNLKTLFPGIDAVPVSRVATANPPTSTPSASGSGGGSPSPSGAASTGITSPIDSLLQACETDIKSSGMRLSEGLLARFVAALITKPFLILTGLSGSGKTRLAQAFAKWMEEVDGQVEVVSVGADWTSNESVLGYRDALDPSKYRIPTSGALDLMLQALNDPTRPYFLILDEMNLSHVERYFADILSSIESEHPIALHSADGDIDGVPPKLPLPANLFLIGTVNIDETTYTFSPKVLDRANVIEFRISSEDIKSYLANPSPIDMSMIVGKGVPFAASFIQAAASDIGLYSSIPAAIADGVAVKSSVENCLIELFDILSPICAEFGYRTAHEIYQFIYWHALLVGPGWKWEDALDAQVIQKVMPKLHGSERRLRPILVQFADFSKTRALRLSQDKVMRMQARLKEGYTSFLD